MKLAKTKRILKMILCILILILFFFRRGGGGLYLHFFFVYVITFNKNAYILQLANNESLEEVSSIINFLILK